MRYERLMSSYTPISDARGAKSSIFFNFSILCRRHFRSYRLGDKFSPTLQPKDFLRGFEVMYGNMLRQAIIGDGEVTVFPALFAA